MPSMMQREIYFILRVRSCRFFSEWPDDGFQIQSHDGACDRRDVLDDCVSSVGVANTSEYAAARSLDERTARRHLLRFDKLGLKRKVGSGRAMKYETN